MRGGLVQNEKNLVAIGDSQTARREFDIANGGATLAQTYPLLAARARGYGCVTNAGVGGETTTQMLARFTTDVLAHSPGAISIMGGANDWASNVSGGSWVGGGISVATCKSNLKSMVQAGQAARARVTLISPAPFRSAVYLANAGGYITAMQEIASETSCEFIDLYTDLVALSAGTLDTLYVTGDFQHINAAGHTYLFDKGLGLGSTIWGQY